MSPAISLSKMSVPELLTFYARIDHELRSRNVTRSANNPVADYSESLCAKGLHLTPANNSTKGFDATDAKGKRYQIKARRLLNAKGSRQLGVLRELDQHPFDMLIGVLLRMDFSVERACAVPIALVRKHSTFIERTNSWRFILRDSIWNLPGVLDVTDRLRDAERQV